MSSRKLQKEIDNTFKKINEGLESFNYHYDRHQDLNGQVLDRNLESQKEKLESDLKREIKKLQKNRELIKNWQLSDTAEVVVTRNKLQEYRKLVEEAMEKYKEVEKSSKMKSFSNQSIMLASLEESQNLPKEAIEVVGFLEESIEEISNQIENLELEYDKLSAKKSKKNSSLESERQELENFLNMDRFHLERFEKIIDYIKQNQIDPNLVLKIKDDITFYLESNQEPDFVDDETLYDEIVQQAESSYKYTPEDDSHPVIEDTVEAKANGGTSNNAHNNSNNTPTSLSKQSSNHNHNHSSVPANNTNDKGKSKSPSPNTPTKKPLEITTPIKNKINPSVPDVASPDIVQKLKPASTPSRVSGEVAWASAAGVAAAVSGAPSSSESDKATLVSNDPHPAKSFTDTSNVLNGSGTVDNNKSANGDNVNSTIESTGNNSSIITDTPTKYTDNGKGPESISTEHPYYNYIQVLNNSGLTDSELKLFSSSDLIRVPPGIQNFIMSFTSSRKIKKEDDIDNDQKMGKLLFNSSSPNSLSTSIRKPYLPKTVQNSFYQYNNDNSEINKFKNGEISNSNNNINNSNNNGSNVPLTFIRPPLHLMNYQNYWNKIRAEDSFDSFTTNIKVLIEQQQQQMSQPGTQIMGSNFEVINELCQVLFYGFFYGVTPLENLIAEAKLFELGWKPYGIKSNQPSKLVDGSSFTGMDMNNGLNPDKYYYWFRSIVPNNESSEPIEFGDYQVFDLNTWEIHLKLAFRFDKSLAVQNPLSIIT